MKKLQGAGLRGQSAGQTSLSTVEQEGSLRYLGFSIEDLASHASFEEVAYLLLLGELPNKNNLEQFENELFKLRTMPDSLGKSSRINTGRSSSNGSCENHNFLYGSHRTRKNIR